MRVTATAALRPLQLRDRRGTRVRAEISDTPGEMLISPDPMRAAFSQPRHAADRLPSSRDHSAPINRGKNFAKKKRKKQGNVPPSATRLVFLFSCSATVRLFSSVIHPVVRIPSLLLLLLPFWLHAPSNEICRSRGKWANSVTFTECLVR